VAPHRRLIRTHRNRWLRLTHRIEKLAAGKENDARAGHGEHPSTPAGISIEIVAAALARADGDGVNH
jgi:hypothetical protein